MKLQVSSPILIIFFNKYANIMTIIWYITLSMYYGIDWNWSGIAIIGIGIELP